MEVPLELFIKQWGPEGLLALFMLLLMFGKLVTKSVHDDVRQQRDEWKKTADEALKQNTKLLESARVADDTFKALKQVSGKEVE